MQNLFIRKVDHLLEDPPLTRFPFTLWPPIQMFSKLEGHSPGKLFPTSFQNLSSLNQKEDGK